ncbi:M56 family metallopeptidase [Saccharomonospora sp. NPDC046836]|uniref:M56 family metallopeptidase n=1 Tax=Saccharomonospora sp. NPDC046836 TaxID=3156921 RepID=UPI0033F10524
MPRVLRRFDVRRHDPVPLIVGWLVSMAGVLLAAAAGLVLLLLPDHAPAGYVMKMVLDCWSAIQHGSTPRVEEWIGPPALAIGAAVALRLLVVGLRQLRDLGRTARQHQSTLRLVGRLLPATPSTVWLAYQRPLAFSIGGRRGLVVATDGLARALPPAQVNAVLEHEYAHLRGRHHLLVGTADSLRTAFPVIPLFAQAPRALRELVELAADAAAVRRFGAGTVHSALCNVAGHDVPGTALGMAADAVNVRLERLLRGNRSPGRGRQASSCGLAVAGGLCLPFLTAAALFAALACTVCPLPAW